MPPNKLGLNFKRDIGMYFSLFQYESYNFKDTDPILIVSTPNTNNKSTNATFR